MPLEKRKKIENNKCETNREKITPEQYVNSHKNEWMDGWKTLDKNKNEMKKKKKTKKNKKKVFN